MLSPEVNRAHMGWRWLGNPGCRPVHLVRIASHVLQSSWQTTCCWSPSELSLPATHACRPPVPLPRILSHGLQEREFHVHSEPVRQGLNKALGELQRMTAGLWGIALQGIRRGSRGNA